MVFQPPRYAPARTDASSSLENRRHHRYKLPVQAAAVPACRLVLGLGVKFNLVDKIEHLSDERIVAVKHVTLAEEYLADHFPTFPVLPGVMMLEAITQAAGWLLHHRRGFACSMAVLKEARNVKYGHFVAPGHFLRVNVELNQLTETGATFKATGTIDQAQALQARVELAYFNLSDKRPALKELDIRLHKHNQTRWSLIAPRTDSATPAI